MQNFDEAHEYLAGTEEGIRVASRDEILGMDRTFMLAGEKFTRKAILHPRVMARFWTLEGDIDQAMLNELYEIATLCVIKEDRERITARFDDEEDPVSYVTLRELLAWFIAEETGRPFTSASASGRGSETAGSTSSTDASRSPETPTAPTPSLSVAS